MFSLLVPHQLEQTNGDNEMKIDSKFVGKRLLTTDTITGIERRECKLVEISPSGKRAKFNNGNNDFWQDLDEVELLEILD